MKSSPTNTSDFAFELTDENHTDEESSHQDKVAIAHTDEPRAKKSKRPNKHRDVEFLVERIMKHRAKGDDYEWYVKWDGYSGDNNTWEPTSSLVDNGKINAALLRYKKKHKL